MPSSRPSYKHTYSDGNAIYHTAATRIQSLIRGHLVRRHILKLHKSTVLIQSLIRRYLAQKTYRRLHAQHATLQKHDIALSKTRDRLRGREVQLRTLKGVAASRVGGWEKARVLKAVVRIQAAVRGFLVRRRLKMDDMKRRQVEMEMETRKRARRLQRRRGHGHGHGSSSSSSSTTSTSTTTPSSSSSSADSRHGTHTSTSDDTTATPTTDTTKSRHLKNNPDDTVNVPPFWKSILTHPPLATLQQANPLTARDTILKNLKEGVRHRYHSLLNTSTSSTSSSHHTTSQLSAAHLLASIQEVTLLVDLYYDVSRLQPYTINGVSVTPSSQDLSLGCLALQTVTDMYLEKLLEYPSTLDQTKPDPTDTDIIPPSILQKARPHHQRALRDGKLRWWENDAFEDSSEDGNGCALGYGLGLGRDGNGSGMDVLDEEEMMMGFEEDVMGCDVEEVGRVYI